MLALGIGLVLASPQLWQSLRYWPRMQRATHGYAEKVALGNIPLWAQLKQLLHPTTASVDGVFGTEAMTFIGLPALICCFWARNPVWMGVALLGTFLAMGKHTPLFRWTHALHLRIPARYTYWISLSLAMLAIDGFSRLPTHVQIVLVLLQCLSLLLRCSRLWPMAPYVQRWQRPSEAFATPVARYLTLVAGASRVSGLPYPLRTGGVNQLHTLGYNGGSQAQWMANLRGDSDPNGSGAHDWFRLNEDGPLLDWYGVRWAYTYRPLQGKWQPTPIPHLYENTQAGPMPRWKEVAHGTVRAGRNAL